MRSLKDSPSKLARSDISRTCSSGHLQKTAYMWWNHGTSRIDGMVTSAAAETTF